MGGRLGTVQNELSTIIKDYTLIQEIPDENISFWEEQKTRRELLLRELCYNDQTAFEKALQTLSIKIKQLNGNSHVAKLIDFKQSTEAQFCATFYKIYVFFEYPQRTLDDEINQRTRMKSQFEEKELWSILASCILGLSHLQKNGIRHGCLRSTAILIDRSGLIKVSDPFALGLTSNYDSLLNKRLVPHIYLCPQLTLSLLNEQMITDTNVYKSDIWTLAMIILEAGLMQYQDECYRDEFSRIHWDALNYNLKVFSEKESHQLTAMIELMLSREEKERPDWVFLEEHVMKVDEDVRKSFVSNPRLTDSNAGYKPAHKKAMSLVPRTPYQKLQPVVESTEQKVQQAKHPRGSSFDSSTLHTEFQGIPPSDISQTRPSRNIFPTPIYSFKTKFDENLVIVNDNNIEDAEYVSEVFTMGSKYEGWKVKGMRHGRGTFYYQDGGMYQGDWVYNRMQGQGKLFYQSGRLAYEGNWHQDKFQGKGILYNQFPQPLHKGFNYRDFHEVDEYWMKYEGMFLDDLKNGKGTLTLSNGERYEGEFKEDTVNGQGLFHTINGEIVKGVWANNIMMS